MSEKQIITDFMAVRSAYEEKKKEMEVVKEHYQTLEKAVMDLMKKYQRNSVVVGDKELVMVYDHKEKTASKEVRKARVLQLLNNNMQNANLVWEAAHMKSGQYDTIETLNIIEKQPYHQRASIGDFK